MQMIAIDLGSTFLKGAVLDLDARSFSHVRRLPFPAPVPGLPPLRYEVDPLQLVDTTRALIDELAGFAPACAGVVLCSQMHGLVLMDRRGEPASNAITWRDQRALEPHPSGRSSVFDQLAQRVPEADRQRLGNELRPGLPISALFWHAAHGMLPERLIPAPLPAFVSARLCGAPPATEPTTAASCGALDLHTGEWHLPLLEQLGLGRLEWPRLNAVTEPVGELRVGQRMAPCYPAVGDQQCALLGAALAPGELSLNIATGSQVSMLRPALASGDYQVRPFFDGAWLQTITHIPAGRALELLIGLLGELPRAQGVELADPWGYIAQAVQATPATDLAVSLDFYAGALGDRGAIANIYEGNLSVGHLFRAAFERMAATYAECGLRLAPAGDWQRLAFSGGLAQQLPVLRNIIVERFRSPYRVCATPEDTLQGLLALALLCSGREPSAVNSAGG